MTLPQVTGPGRASPVPAATLDTFRAPYAGEFLTAALPGSSPLPWPSPRFREARHSLARPEGRLSNDAAGFASCYGPHRRSPRKGFCRWAPAPPVSRRNRQPATGPPGSYPDRTHTGRRRRAYEHEEPPWHYVTVLPPVLLGARDHLSAVITFHNSPSMCLTRPSHRDARLSGSRARQSLLFSYVDGPPARRGTPSWCSGPRSSRSRESRDL